MDDLRQFSSTTATAAPTIAQERNPGLAVAVDDNLFILISESRSSFQGSLLRLPVDRPRCPYEASCTELDISAAVGLEGELVVACVVDVCTVGVDAEIAVSYMNIDVCRCCPD